MASWSATPGDSDRRSPAEHRDAHPVAATLGQGRLSFARGWLLLFALALLWATLRALWVRFEEPGGVDLPAVGLNQSVDAAKQGRFA